MNQTQSHQHFDSNSNPGLPELHTPTTNFFIHFRYPWSKALHLKCLQNQSQATIAWNAKEIMTSDDWVAMEFDFLQVRTENNPQRQGTPINM